MNRTLRALLTNLIDYAGLFPPAALDMQSAVRNYSSYFKSENAHCLGRFVVPVARLEEFEQAAKRYSPENAAWRLTVLSGTELAADLRKIAAFNERHGDDGIRVDTIEVKATQDEDIRSSMKLITGLLTPYFEIPIANDPTELIKTIAGTDARAKVRTGGISVDAFPSSFNLARFIKTCADEDVAFKATAGLHHPLRSINRLTYEPDSMAALMHGFLNVFLAAAFAQNGMSLELLVELLEERSLEALRFEDDSVIWRNQMIVISHIRNARRLFAISFGSCSFEEPLGDLKKINFL